MNIDGNYNDRRIYRVAFKKLLITIVIKSSIVFIRFLTFYIVVFIFNILI